MKYSRSVWTAAEICKKSIDKEEEVSFFRFTEDSFIFFTLIPKLVVLRPSEKNCADYVYFRHETSEPFTRFYCSNAEGVEMWNDEPLTISKYEDFGLFYRTSTGSRGAKFWFIVSGFSFSTKLLFPRLKEKCQNSYSCENMYVVTLLSDSVAKRVIFQRRKSYHTENKYLLKNIEWSRNSRLICISQLAEDI